VELVRIILPILRAGGHDEKAHDKSSHIVLVCATGDSERL
jgi:hypothetical protein